MNNDDLISIVLPTRNRETYLRLAIEGCLAQTHKNFELIIVNDGSTDGTKEVATSYASRDSRITVISNEINIGISASLNLGFSRARGAYFTWTSDDNIHEPDAFAVMLRTLLMYPDMEITFCDFKTIDKNGDVLGVVALHEDGELDRWDTLGACFLYKRAVHEIIGGYNPAVDIISDYKFWLQCYERFNVIKTVGVTPYLYRLHQDSITSRKTCETFIKVTLERKHYRVSCGGRRLGLLRAYLSILRKLVRELPGPNKSFSLVEYLSFAPTLLSYLLTFSGKDKIAIFYRDEKQHTPR